MEKNRIAFQINYGLISKYRAVLMGTAIILILFCHLNTARVHNGIDPSRLSVLLSAFTGGVDIFMFLSGFGLWYSYSKKKTSYFSFEKRRLLRILPLYFVIAGITYFLNDLVINHLTFGKFLWDLSFVSWFREGSTRYWYILASTVFYLLFPILYHIIDGGKHRVLRTAAVCAVWWIVTELLFWK